MLQIALSKNEPETESDVYKIAKKNGYTVAGKQNEKSGDVEYTLYFLKKNKVGAPSKKIPKDKILELRKAGKTINAIAKELNISRSSVYNYLK